MQPCPLCLCLGPREGLVRQFPLHFFFYRQKQMKRETVNNYVREAFCLRHFQEGAEAGGRGKQALLFLSHLLSLSLSLSSLSSLISPLISYMSHLIYPPRHCQLGVGHLKREAQEHCCSQCYSSHAVYAQPDPGDRQTDRLPYSQANVYRWFPEEGTFSGNPVGGSEAQYWW